MEGRGTMNAEHNTEIHNYRIQGLVKKNVPNQLSY